MKNNNPGIIDSTNTDSKMPPAYTLTLSGPAFSVVRQARGAQRPGCQKSKLTSTD